MVVEWDLMVVEWWLNSVVIAGLMWSNDVL